MNLRIFISLMVVFFLSSCMKKTTDAGVKAKFIIETTDRFYVFSNETREFQQLMKPVKLDTINSNGTDLILIRAAQNSNGMTRFVNGEEDNDFGIMPEGWALMVIVAVIVFDIGASVGKHLD